MRLSSPFHNGLGVCVERRAVARPRHRHVRCAKPDATDEKRLQVVEQAKERMKKRGIDKATARQILRVWRDKGVDGDPQQLRKVQPCNRPASMADLPSSQLLVDNSMRNVTKVVVQLGFDAVASGWSFFSASQVAQAPEMGWVQFPLELVLTFVGFYFAIGALLNITTLGCVQDAQLFSTKA